MNANSNAAIINGQRRLEKAHRTHKREYTPEEIKQRKLCIVCARDYYLAVDIAAEQLSLADRLREKQDVIDREKNLIYRNLLKVVEKCLRSADWATSLFFQGVGNRIRAMRDEIRKHLSQSQHDFLSPEATDIDQCARDGMTLVFVSLYQADGNNLKKWSNLIGNITRLSVGRPVYENEKAIRDVIRAKAEPRRDAYVAVYVFEDDIIEPLGGIKPRDRVGNELLTIREGCIKSDNVFEFIHNSGVQTTRYSFESNKLYAKEND